MNRIKLILVIAIILFPLCKLYAQEGDLIKKYYLDIESVNIGAPYYDTLDNSFMRIRVLTISSGVYQSLKIECIDLGKDESDGKSLAESYNVGADDFDLFVIHEIQVVEWFNPNKFKVRIDDDNIFIVTVQRLNKNIYIEN